MINPVRVLKKKNKAVVKAKTAQKAKQTAAMQQQQMAQQQAAAQQAQQPQQQATSPSFNNGKDSIHIKKSKRGTFTKAANANGSSVQGFASKVLKAPKGKYSAAMRKKANFAIQSKKWHH